MPSKAQVVDNPVSEKEWADMWRQLNEILMVFGFILFSPFIVLVGACHGVRVGIIAGTAKTLYLFRKWGK